MAEIMDDVVHLSQEIGPHPAGTEEEQQAALYLAEEIRISCSDRRFSVCCQLSDT